MEDMMRRLQSTENNHTLPRFQNVVWVSLIAAAFWIAIPLDAGAQAHDTNGAKQSVTHLAGSSPQVSSNPVDSPRNPQVQGCGNSGNPNCPPKECHRNLCGDAHDCRKIKSCDSD